MTLGRHLVLSVTLCVISVMILLLWRGPSWQMKTMSEVFMAPVYLVCGCLILSDCHM